MSRRAKEHDYMPREDRDLLRTFIQEKVVYNPVNGHLHFQHGGGRMRVHVNVDRSDAATYGRCTIAGRLLIAARVAYLLKNGEWPERAIEFENGDETDIRWSNLFLVPIEGSVTGEPDKAELNEMDEASPLVEANRLFLEDLKKYQPRGPITYKITSKGVTAHYSTYHQASMGSSAFMCTEV